MINLNQSKPVVTEGQHLSDMAKLASCTVNLAICEATLAAIKAVTLDPEMSAVVEKHNNACAEAYCELQTAVHHLEAEIELGTKEEWEALSDEDKCLEWDRFHSLCAQGNGDEMYFYKVLMSQWLAGYVGH